eukprot:339866-Prorocentrum_minimum.AAC.1
MSVGPKKGREVGESRELDTGRERGTGLWGDVCALAVTCTVCKNTQCNVIIAVGIVVPLTVDVVGVAFLGGGGGGTTPQSDPLHRAVDVAVVVIDGDGRVGLLGEGGGQRHRQ